MPTLVMSKQGLIDYINSIPDDKGLLLSQDINGTIKVTKKTNTKDIPIAFSQECFKHADGVGDIFKGQCIPVCIMIIDADQKSDKLIELENQLRDANKG